MQNDRQTALLILGVTMPFQILTSGIATGAPDFWLTIASLIWTLFLMLSVVGAQKEATNMIIAPKSLGLWKIAMNWSLHAMIAPFVISWASWIVLAAGAFLSLVWVGSVVRVNKG